VKHASVVVPTHNHDQTLLSSIESARRQSVDDLEILVVGDGTTDQTRSIVNEFITQDKRIKFFDLPKGKRLGEHYRHQILKDVDSLIVTYLSDDDLYHPRHVEQMLELLSHADFASTPAVWVGEDESVEVSYANLPGADRETMISRAINKVPLACGAHTLSFYNKLPHGWRTTPDGIPTDLYMWQQFLSQADCKAVSGFRPTVVKFPGRYTTDPQLRHLEMEKWLKLLALDIQPDSFQSICT